MTQFHRDLLPQSSPLPHPDPYLRAQTQLLPGDSLLSATGAFLFAMANRGDITLSVWDESIAGWRQILSFGTNGATKCVMQDDGNLVVSKNSTPIWSSMPYWYTALPGHDSHSFFRCQDDGNLVVLTGAGAPLGSSNTYAGPR